MIDEERLLRGRSPGSGREPILYFQKTVMEGEKRGEGNRQKRHSGSPILESRKPVLELTNQI